MNKYRLRPDDKRNQRYKFKDKSINFQNSEPPPTLELEGRMGVIGIEYLLCGTVFFLIQIAFCVLIFNQRDNWWVLEILIFSLFLGGLGTLFLKVGIRLYSKGVQQRKRLKRIEKKY